MWLLHNVQEHHAQAWQASWPGNSNEIFQNTEEGKNELVNQTIIGLESDITESKLMH